jgi:cytochrome c peroxidase
VLIFGGVLGLTVLLPSCRLEGDDRPTSELEYRLDLPEGFPVMPIPPDNALTKARVSLGKRLFFDPILSRDSTISCGSCHFQELGFADATPFSDGIDGRQGFRNSPTLTNLGWHPYFFMDGGVPTLELQVLAPIDAHFEMDSKLLDVVNKLKRHRQYPALMREAYGDAPIPYALTRAIAAFERTLVTGDSPWDRYSTGRDPSALSPSALRGWNLFKSDSLHCAVCHAGFDFSDYSFQNIGLPVTTADSGRMRITLNEAHRNQYKTPSLRNVALSAPYMHDGSIATLEAVIEHFASGGMGDPNQSPFVQGFVITASEKADLLAFLHALTDETFVSNPEFAR